MKKTIFTGIILALLAPSVFAKDEGYVAHCSFTDEKSKVVTTIPSFNFNQNDTKNIPYSKDPNLFLNLKHEKGKFELSVYDEETFMNATNSLSGEHGSMNASLRSPTYAIQGACNVDLIFNEERMIHRQE